MEVVISILSSNISTFNENIYYGYLCIIISSYLEKAMAPHSSTLAWKIPRMEEPGRLQSMGSLRVGHNWVTSLSLFTFMHWRRKWQPTPVFLPGESQGRWCLMDCCLWVHTARSGESCVLDRIPWMSQKVCVHTSHHFHLSLVMSQEHHEGLITSVLRL